MNRSDLRNSHTRNDASRADRTRSNTDLHSVDTCIDQSLSAFGRCDVAANDLNAIKSRVRLDLTDHLQCQSCAAVCGVYYQDIDTRITKRTRTLPGISPVAHCSANHEAAAFILCCVRVLLSLDEVLNGNQTRQSPILIDNRQLFNAVRRKQSLRFFTASSNLSGYQSFARSHAITNLQGSPLIRGNEA